MNRGEIWWASLPIPKASEPGFRRPIVIVQSDDFNRSRINTVIVVILTSNIKLGLSPGNLLLKPKETGLKKDSVANVSQLVTADRTFLIEKIGVLSPNKMRQLEDGLRLVLFL